MASKHILEGLIKWSTRDRWADRFERILEDHLLPTCDETGLAIDDIVATVGEDLFMSTVWACAFEDFLTREFDDGGNAIDDYLKRRGWGGLFRVSPGERHVLELDQPGKVRCGIACRRAIAAIVDLRNLA